MDPIPDWQLPPGVDRGLWDYLHSGDMVAGYDEQMAASPLALADVAFCEKWFPTPGKLLDLGCGTGRLCRHFAKRGFECLGVDLSEEMLAKAREAACNLAIQYRYANLIELAELPDAGFDYAACLFSTLGMVRGAESRAKVFANAFRLLRPGGRFVLHVHNRYFLGLGWRNWGRGDITMPQAYGGAPLTLHHFTNREAVRMLNNAGFIVNEIWPIGITGSRAQWPTWVRAYGWLIVAARR
jgi:SAM-dependent methyltransferase